VDIDTTALSPDGLTWETAVPTVQEGIDLASELAVAGVPCDVWVAEGTYYIYESDPYDTVRLMPHIHLYGGFSGSEELAVERDWSAHTTTLDGSNGPGGAFHVYHVVTIWEMEDILMGDVDVDGFTITGGRTIEEYPMPMPDTAGAGIVIVNASDTVVSNCVFRDNVALSDGMGNGGALMYSECSPTIRNCVFENNVAGDSGGAIAHSHGSPVIEGCTFHNNTASVGGAIGGIMSTSSPVIKDCLFLGNTGDSGGAIYQNDDWARLENCVFHDNHADVQGGVMFVEHSEVEFVNCTFYRNTAVLGAGLILGEFSSVDIMNSIIWDVSTPHTDTSRGEFTVDIGYSDVEGGYTMDGNIISDPLFVDPDGGDLRLRPGSPCIDAAHGDHAPHLDMDGFPRHDDPETPNTGVGSRDYVDMGAYEYWP
jgi:hypothetical protein